MFYDKFKELCAKKGISPFAAARDLGISSRTQGNWKKGSEPRFTTLMKIADYFHVPVSYFDEEYEINETDADTPLVRDFIKDLRRDLSDNEQLLIDMFRTMSEGKQQDLLRTAMRMKLEDEK